MTEFVEQSCSLYEPQEVISYGSSVSTSYFFTAFTLTLFSSSDEVNTTEPWWNLLPHGKEKLALLTQEAATRLLVSEICSF